MAGNAICQRFVGSPVAVASADVRSCTCLLKAEVEALALTLRRAKSKAMQQMIEIID
jgi:hypothetical protein